MPFKSFLNQAMNPYPKDKKATVLFSLRFLFLILLEGLGVLIWLMLEPSEPQSRFFLLYSLERWGLVLANLGFIFFILFLLWGIKEKTRWFDSCLDHVKKEKYVGILLFFLIALFFLTIGLITSLQGKFPAYYLELRPLLFLAVMSIAQLLFFYLIETRHILAEMIRTYFPVNEEIQIYPINSKRILIILAGISFIYLFFQIQVYLNIREAAHLGDTTSYLEGASFSLNDPAFFRERRPWGIALAYKVLGRSLAAIDFAQVFVSTLAWLSLACFFSRSLREGWAKVVSFLVILGFSFHPVVQVWNHSALSESFTISFTILILAFLIAIMQEWQKGKFIALLFLFVFWMSVHEVNLYIGLLVAIAFLVFGAFKKDSRFLWVFSVLIGIVFVVNYQLSSAYALPRWGLPLAEVVTKRILPNEEFLNFFAEEGMPLNPALMALSGEWANSRNYVVVNNPDLKPFSEWLFADGKRVYTKFLLTHPLYAITAPLEDIEPSLASSFEEMVPKYTPALPNPINEFFYPIRFFWLCFWTSLVIVFFTFTRNFRGNNKTFWVVFIFWLISTPYLYLTWHGDAHSVVRHVVIANIQFHLGIWLVLLINLNGVGKQKKRN